MKNLFLLNVSIHRNFYQNQLINKYARKKKPKISESRSPGFLEFFLIKHRRTYILKNNYPIKFDLELLELKVRLSIRSKSHESQTVSKMSLKNVGQIFEMFKKKGRGTCYLLSFSPLPFLDCQ